MSLRALIEHQMRQIAAERHKVIELLHDDYVLLNSGMDSLSFAVLMARLEDELGCDPFRSEVDFAFPITFGDLVRIYDRACLQAEVSSPAGGSAKPQPLVTC